MGDPLETKPPPPSWVNKEFVEKALRKGKDNSKLEVVSMTVDYATKEGSGFASLIFRVVARINDGLNDDTYQKAIVVKCSHEAGKIKELADEMNFFEIEPLVLSEVMPQIHKILKSVEGDSFRPLAAQCFDHGKLPLDFLVLEDLVASGFRLAEAGKPLDLDHCRMAMCSYGRLHGASVLLLRQQPKYRELLAKDGFSDNIMDEFFSNFSSKLFLAAANEMNKHEGYEKYAELYRKASNKMIFRMVEVMKKQQQATKLTILTHGDCWKNNMMFKYSENRVEEIRLVDFQITSANSPVRDLAYFLYANAGVEVHRDHLDSLLAEYHSTLDSTLRALELDDAADGYPLEELKTEMDDYLLVCILFTLMSGFVLTSEKVGPDFIKSFNDEKCFGEVFERTYDNPYSASYLRYQSEIFERKGLL